MLRLARTITRLRFSKAVPNSKTVKSIEKRRIMMSKDLVDFKKSVHLSALDMITHIIVLTVIEHKFADSIPS